MSPSINPRIKNKKNLSILNSDYIIVSLFLEKLNTYKAGKLVLLQHPEDDELVVRLLVGLPGDWIKSKSLNVFHKVPEGHCWVECLKGEDDSTTWGPIPLALIKGRSVLLIRPFKKLIPASKITKNMKNKLDVKSRKIQDDSIENFFV